MFNIKVTFNYNKPSGQTSGKVGAVLNSNLYDI